ncbi:hypothetical protein [Methyloligella halotolerans]|uniref:hypothetical protein n=1 Tax=Methyloligella halotolerans TaxID=1177755 RepID=UPI00114D0BB0|nr:hypothetical protein [Methyloligella halotolerans]
MAEPTDVGPLAGNCRRFHSEAVESTGDKFFRLPQITHGDRETASFVTDPDSFHKKNRRGFSAPVNRLVK